MAGSVEIKEDIFGPLRGEGEFLKGRKLEIDVEK